MIGVAWFIIKKYEYSIGLTQFIYRIDTKYFVCVHWFESLQFISEFHQDKCSFILSQQEYKFISWEQNWMFCTYNGSQLVKII